MCWHTEETIPDSFSLSIDIFGILVEYFFCYLSPSLLPISLFSLVLGFVFHERHVKHTGSRWKERSANVNCSLFFFLSARICEGRTKGGRKKEWRRRVAEIPGKDSLQKPVVPSAAGSVSRAGCSVSKYPLFCCCCCCCSWAPARVML